MTIRTDLPGDEQAQAEIYNAVTDSLPGWTGLLASSSRMLQQRARAVTLSRKIEHSARDLGSPNGCGEVAMLKSWRKARL